MSRITSLGKYHILERLSADWVSEIFKVKTVGIAGFEKVQVLKRILPNFSQDPRFFRTFIEEAKIAFSLNHRNIVQVFEFGKTGEDLFLAMEHIPGMNLGAVLRSARQQRRVYPVGLTCYLMGEVAAGLEYAHRKADHYGNCMGIVHCDLNPRNVACSFEGSVKILGFGLSRTGWLMARDGQRYPGNPRYLSPEQVHGENLDVRSDMFSFGVILWELLTGMPLFEGTTRDVLLRQIVQEPIPNPRSLNPEVPSRLDDLTMHCLVRDLGQRCENASDMQMALHQVQRSLGAVIGSRALSTFLDDLFPDHSETVDVRHESTPDASLPWADAPQQADAGDAFFGDPAASPAPGPGPAEGGAGRWVEGQAYSVPGLDPEGSFAQQPEPVPPGTSHGHPLEQDPLFGPPPGGERDDVSSYLGSWRPPLIDPAEAAAGRSAVAYPPGLRHDRAAGAGFGADATGGPSSVVQWDEYSGGGGRPPADGPVQPRATANLRGGQVGEDEFAGDAFEHHDAEDQEGLQQVPTAGVLRSGRLPEDDPSEVFLLHKRSAPPAGVASSLVSSDEQTAQPLQTSASAHGEAPEYLDDYDSPEPSMEEIDAEDLIEVELEEDDDEFDDGTTAGGVRDEEPTFSPEQRYPSLGDDQPTYLPLGNQAGLMPVDSKPETYVSEIQVELDPNRALDPGSEGPFDQLPDPDALQEAAEDQPTFLPVGSVLLPTPVEDSGDEHPTLTPQQRDPARLSVRDSQPTFLPVNERQPGLRPVDLDPDAVARRSTPSSGLMPVDSRPVTVDEAEGGEAAAEAAEQAPGQVTEDLGVFDQDPAAAPDPPPEDQHDAPRETIEPQVVGDPLDQPATGRSTLQGMGSDGLPQEQLLDPTVTSTSDATPVVQVDPQLTAAPALAPLRSPDTSPTDERVVPAGPPPLDQRPTPGVDLIPELLETLKEPDAEERLKHLVQDYEAAAQRAQDPPRGPDHAPSPAAPPGEALVDLTQEAPPLALEHDPAQPRPAPPAQEPDAGATEAPRGLGEKKRFIAVSVLLEQGDQAPQDDAVSLVADIAYKRGGIVHRQDGGRLVVLFGLPTADEHDIVAAVRFALDTREAVDHLAVGGADEPASPMTIRTGIRAGTARMSARPSREGYQLLGNTVRETEAIAGHADQGQIIISGVAARLARAHYALREVAPLVRRGKRARCLRVTGPVMPLQLDEAEAARPFHGREVELRALKTALQEAVLHGVQRAVLIVGEAGIGKTRLLDQLLRNHGADVKVVAVAATPHRGGTPNALLLDLVRGLTALQGVGEVSFRKQLRPALEQLLDRQTRDQDIRTLVSLLAIPGTAPAPDTGGKLGRRRLRRALRKLLNAVSAERPTVVVVEDLHWADRASVQVVTHLVGHPGDSRSALMFVCSARPEEGVFSQQLVRSGTADVVLLDELSPDERRRLIQAELGKLATEELINEVEGRAGGNPLYIHELTQSLTEMGSPGPSDVPPTVQRVIAGRVDRLPAEAKAALQHAAVIGPTFSEVILSRLLAGNPARALGTLRNRGIIVPGLQLVAGRHKQRETEHFERTWAFRNVMIQEVVYEAISAVARKGLHCKVGQIMAKRAQQGANDPPAEVARHLELGGAPRLAARFYKRAGNEAAACYAGQEALELYDKALRFSEGDDEQRYAIFAGRERVYSQLGLHAKQAHDLQELARLSGDDPARLADLRNREALRLLRLGELQRGLSAAGEAEAAATQAGDHLARGEALRLQGEAHERLNDHAEAIESVSEALRLFEQQQSLPNQIRARITIGRILLVQARYEEALDHWEPALDLAKQAEDHWQERLLRNHLAVAHYCMGFFTRALGEALYSLRLCEQFGDRAREGDNASVVGIVYLELGLRDAARKYLEAAVAIHQETGSQWSEADTLVYVGLLEAAAQRFSSALRYLDRAKEIATRISARSIVMNARNATAWTLCERNQAEDAIRAVDEATEAADTARSIGLVVGEIPGLSRAARATALLGDLDSARALSRRAVQLLETQRYIESPEEEVYYTHYRILHALGDNRAQQNLERAHQRLVAKMDLLDSADWLKAFVEQVRLNVAISRDHDALDGTESS